MKKLLCVNVSPLRLLLGAIAVVPLLASAQKAPNIATRDLVTRAETATAIAKAVADERYGADAVNVQLPLRATKEEALWHVQGKLPPGIPGGIIEVWVSQRDGKVVRITSAK